MMKLPIAIFLLISVTCVLLFPDKGRAETSIYLKRVTAYADAMIDKGRDSYGKKQTPLFAVMLNRKSMRIDDYPEGKKNFPNVTGVRGKDRSNKGANPQDDVALYEILYTLSELTGDKSYAAAADDALKYFFTHCLSPQTDLPAWGEHVFWNLEHEKMGPRRDKYHEIRGAWPYWDRCYELAPASCWKVAMAYWDHQIHDKKTGNFSRHALWYSHKPGKDMEFPRYAGQMILAWAGAYARPQNAKQPRRDELLQAIGVVMKRMRRNMTLHEKGWLPACSFWPQKYWPTSNLELARCLFEAMPLVRQSDRQLADEMEQLALIQDKHYFESAPKIADTKSSVWAAGYGSSSNASEACRAYRRYVQLKQNHPALARQYQELVLGAAALYMKGQPKKSKELRPDTIAPPLELMLSAHEMTGDRKYLDRAREFADMGLTLFFDDDSPLPKASNRHGHYEAITGGPRLLLLMLRLHQIERGRLDRSKPIIEPDLN